MIKKALTPTLLLLLFTLFYPRHSHAVCMGQIDSNVTISAGDTCTIPAGTTYYIDNATTEASSTTNGQITLTGGSLTIANTGILKTNKLVPNGGSIIIQNGGRIDITANTTSLWVVDADADGYPLNWTTYTASASGRRRAGLMKTKTLVDCNDADANIKIQGATGGTITYSGNYAIHTFTTSGTFNLNCGGGSGNIGADLTEQIATGEVLRGCRNLVNKPARHIELAGIRLVSCDG